MALAKSTKDPKADDDDGELFGEAEEPQLSKQEIHHAQLNQPQNRGDTSQARYPLNPWLGGNRPYTIFTLGYDHQEDITHVSRSR